MVCVFSVYVLPTTEDIIRVMHRLRSLSFPICDAIFILQTVAKDALDVLSTMKMTHNTPKTPKVDILHFSTKMTLICYRILSHHLATESPHCGSLSGFSTINLLVCVSNSEAA